MKKVRMVFLVLGLAGVVFMGGFSFKEILRGEKLSATPLGRPYSDGLFVREAIASSCEKCPKSLMEVSDTCWQECNNEFPTVTKWPISSNDITPCQKGCYNFGRAYRNACQGKIVW